LPRKPGAGLLGPPGTHDAVAGVMANRYRREAIYSATSGAAVAMNCRNKSRCCKRLTLREAGLIMQFA